jgi:hypothetical protein
MEKIRVRPKPFAFICVHRRFQFLSFFLGALGVLGGSFLVGPTKKPARPKAPPVYKLFQSTVNSPAILAGSAPTQDGSAI